jgi:very-short-patch-repair endonuclease
MLDVGLKPLCQFQFEFYRADFAFPQEKIIVEADGKQWHSTPKQKRSDKRRQRWLEKDGWKVLRFTGSEIFNNASECAEIIKREVLKHEASKHSTSFHKRRNRTVRRRSKNRYY